jgi:hypothetical protein
LLLNLGLNIDEVQLPYKTLECLPRERFYKTVCLYGTGGDLFDVDGAFLNLLTQPVLVYIDIAQAGCEERFLCLQKAYCLPVV